MSSVPPLGGLTPEQFLTEYWHKKPLLIRKAVTDVGPPVGFEGLAELALRDDVESRLIENRGGHWHLERGPFRPSRFRRLPESDWTLLVQSVNHHLPHIDALLWRFNFVPYARLDDLMISYAPPGGTVGPHFDSYDVFLLQVGGRKRWQISAQKDERFLENEPIRVLQDFQVEEEYILEEGDMLYLPPKYAHYGVALEPGMTYSIGFRAPTAQELTTQFLVYLQDRICMEGRYSDPDLALTGTPAAIETPMVEQVASMLDRIVWDRDTVGDFLGHYLTEPKAHVFYDAPDDPMDEATFEDVVHTAGLVLDPKSQILYLGEAVFCNGERLNVPSQDVVQWQQFANARRLAAGPVSEEMLDTLYEGYLSGYWHEASGVA